MGQTNIVITQLAQLGFADRIAQEAQGNAEAARQAAQQAAPEALKKRKDSIEKTEDAESSRAIKAEKDGKGGQGGATRKQRRKGTPPPGEDACSAADSPWSGNIVNLKV